MNKIKVYMELPYIGTENYDSDVVDAFGYVEVSHDEIGKYILARQFRDNCSSECGCDKDYINPAFLMVNGNFQEKLSEDSLSLYENIKFFESMNHIRDEAVKIIRDGLANNNDLIIYKLTTESVNYKWATLIVVEIIKNS